MDTCSLYEWVHVFIVIQLQGNDFNFCIAIIYVFSIIKQEIAKHILNGE